MEVWILPGDLESFIPRQAMDSELRGPMKFDEVTFPFGVQQRKCVDAKPLHHPKRSWDPSIAHGPEHGVGGLGLKGKEIPEVVVCRLAGRHLIVWLGLDGVNEVGELHGILNEKHRNIVPAEKV